MSDILFLSDVRLSFPNLAEPQKTTNQQTGEVRISYNAELLMPETHEGFKAFMTQYQKLMQTQFPEHWQQVMQLIAADRKTRCFGRGEEKVNKKTFKPYDGYEGNCYLTVGGKNPPQMIQADGKPADASNTMLYQQLARKMYGGCRVNVAVKPWVQNNSHGRGIRCDLIAIQFAKDDTAFGGGAPDASNLFGAVAASAAPGFGVVAEAAPAMPLPPFMAR